MRLCGVMICEDGARGLFEALCNSAEFSSAFTDHLTTGVESLYSVVPITVLK